jgi:hypothetical protein
MLTWFCFSEFVKQRNQRYVSDEEDDDDDDDDDDDANGENISFVPSTPRQRDSTRYFLINLNQNCTLKILLDNYK